MFFLSEKTQIPQRDKINRLLLTLTLIGIMGTGVEILSGSSVNTFSLISLIVAFGGILFLLFKNSTNQFEEQKKNDDQLVLSQNTALIFEKLRSLFRITEQTRLGIHTYSDLIILLNNFLTIIYDIFPVKGTCCFLLNSKNQIEFFSETGSYTYDKIIIERFIKNSRYLLDINRVEKVQDDKVPSELMDCIFIPLCADGNGHGGFLLKPGNDEFWGNDDHQKMLKCFSAILNTAFYNWCLFETRKEANEKLNKEVFKISVLYNIGQAISFIDDLKKLLSLILDKAISALNAQKGSLMLLNDDDELVVRVVRGIAPDVEEKINSGEIQCTRFKIGEGVAGKVLQNGKSLLINEGQNDSRFKNSTKSFQVDSIICVPLIAKDDPIGVINMTNKKSGQQFNEEDVELLSALATQAASAIKNAQLYEMAVTDGLTHLYTHRYFQGCMDNELIRSKRYGANVSLLLTDIDHFKSFNDDYGHQAGDYVLAEVAKIVQGAIREIDTAARYGGEEFICILPETPNEGAMIVAERLRKRIETAKFEFEGNVFQVTTSVGCSTFPEHSRDKMELIKFCDQSLYYAKENGRNMSVSYETIKKLEEEELKELEA